MRRSSGKCFLFGHLYSSIVSVEAMIEVALVNRVLFSHLSPVRSVVALHSQLLTAFEEAVLNFYVPW